MDGIYLAYSVLFFFFSFLNERNLMAVMLHLEGINFGAYVIRTVSHKNRKITISYIFCCIFSIFFL